MYMYMACTYWHSDSNSIMFLPFQDTAAAYRNEALIGKALKELCPKHNLRPEEVFITSKLGTVQHFRTKHSIHTNMKSSSTFM